MDEFQSVMIYLNKASKMKKLFIALIMTANVIMISSCSGVKFIKAYSSTGIDRKYENQIFSKPGIRYRVGVLPQDWNMITLEYGDLAFYNGTINSTININSTCSSSAKYNLSLLSDSLLTGLQKRQLIERSIVWVNREEALESKYFGRLDEDEVEISIVVYQLDDCVYDFSYIADEPDFETGYKDYMNFVSDFELLDYES